MPHDTDEPMPPCTDPPLRVADLTHDVDALREHIEHENDRLVMLHGKYAPLPTAPEVRP